MLRVAFFLGFLALSHATTNGSPIQSTKEGMDKDLMMSDGDQEKMNPGEDMKSTVDLGEVMNKCNDSFRIEMAYIEALDESGSFPDETDRTPKCYVRCVLETSGVASEDGKYDPARAAEVFSGERGGKTMTNLKGLADGCTDRTEACKCERAYKFMKCFVEAQIKEYVSN